MASINQWLGTTGEAYFIIPKDIDQNSYIYKNYIYYNSVGQRIIKEVIIGFVSFIIGFLLLIYILKKKMRRCILFKKLKKRYNNIPLDLRIFIFIILFIYNKCYI